MFMRDQLFTFFLANKQHSFLTSDLLKDRFIHPDNLITPLEKLVTEISQGLINVCNNYIVSFKKHIKVADEFIELIKTIDHTNGCDLKNLCLLIMLTKGLENYLYTKNASKFLDLLDQFMENNGLGDKFGQCMLNFSIGQNRNPTAIICSRSLADFICEGFPGVIFEMNVYFQEMMIFDKDSREVLLESFERVAWYCSEMEYTSDCYADDAWKESFKKYTIQALVEKILLALPALLKNQTKASYSLKQ